MKLPPIIDLECISQYFQNPIPAFVNCRPGKSTTHPAHIENTFNLRLVKKVACRRVVDGNYAGVTGPLELLLKARMENNRVVEQHGPADSVLGECVRINLKAGGGNVQFRQPLRQ